MQDDRDDEAGELMKREKNGSPKRHLYTIQNDDDRFLTKSKLRIEKAGNLILKVIKEGRPYVCIIQNDDDKGETSVAYGNIVPLTTVQSRVVNVN